MTSELFKNEKNLIESVLEPEEIISILEARGKNDTDIAVTVTPDEYIQSYVRPMLKIGYELSVEKSSAICLVFIKKAETEITLSLEQER